MERGGPPCTVFVPRVSLSNLKYVGEWFHGSPHGNGTFYLPNGMRFEGEFHYGQMKGRGTIFNSDGTVQSSGLRVQKGPWDSGTGTMIFFPGAWNNNGVVSPNSPNGGVSVSNGNNNNNVVTKTGDVGNNKIKAKLPRSGGIMDSLGNFFKNLLGFGASRR